MQRCSEGASLALVAVARASGEPVGCGGATAKAPPTILRPLDEPHAVSIMARVFRELGLEPVRNRIIKFGPNDAELRLDVAAKDRRFGIAYITWQDADQLGDVAAPSGAIRTQSSSCRATATTTDVHAALLFAADYMQDDLSGEQHTSTAIAAEQKLELATRDVLRRAEHENWP